MSVFPTAFELSDPSNSPEIEIAAGMALLAMGACSIQRMDPDIEANQRRLARGKPLLPVYATVKRTVTPLH